MLYTLKSKCGVLLWDLLYIPFSIWKMYYFLIRVHCGVPLGNSAVLKVETFRFKYIKCGGGETLHYGNIKRLIETDRSKGSRLTSAVMALAFALTS